MLLIKVPISLSFTSKIYSDVSKQNVCCIIARSKITLTLQSKVSDLCDYFSQQFDQFLHFLYSLFSFQILQFFLILFTRVIIRIRIFAKKNLYQINYGFHIMIFLILLIISRNYYNISNRKLFIKSIIFDEFDKINMKDKQKNSRIQYCSPQVPERQKRFKRNFYNDNHSKSSSNCSQSSSISKFYVKNINATISKNSMTDILQGKKSKVIEQKNAKQKKRYTPFNLYGLGGNEQQKKNTDKRKNQQNNITSLAKLQTQDFEAQAYILRNKNLQLNLQCQSSKGKVRMLQILLQKQQKKCKKLDTQFQQCKKQLKQFKNGQKRTKQQVHKLKTLLKQKDNLMSHIHSNKDNNEALIKKILQQQNKITALTHKIDNLEQISKCGESSNSLSLSFNCKQKQNQQVSNSSQPDWKQYLCQKEEELFKCKQKNKNLQIQINCLNSKWSKQVSLIKKHKDIEYNEIKVKYKALLAQYKDAVKQNLTKMKQNYQQKQKQLRTPRKRNLTLDNMKLRPFMSQVKQNKFPQSQKQIQLLEYSSCED